MVFRPHSFKGKTTIALFAMFFAFFVFAHDTLVARPYLLGSHSDSGLPSYRKNIETTRFYHDCPLDHGGITFNGLVHFEFHFNLTLTHRTKDQASVHSEWNSDTPTLRGPPATS